MYGMATPAILILKLAGLVLLAAVVIGLIAAVRMA